MASRKFKMNALRAHLKAIQDLIDESDASVAAAQDDNANKLDREKNDKARAQDSPRVGGMDSARTMRKLVPNYGRLADGTGGRGDAAADSGLRVNVRQIGRDGQEVV
jgi:hypothetical protein